VSNPLKLASKYAQKEEASFFVIYKEGDLSTFHSKIASSAILVVDYI